LVLLALIACSFAYEELSPDSLRLLEFNESHREFLPFSYVQKHLVECGKTGKHGGFFDITDHQKVAPAVTYRNAHAYPTNPAHEELVNRFIATMQKPNIATFNNMLTKRSTRYYTSQTGKDAAQDIYNTFIQYKNQHNRQDVKVDFFSHSWLQPSVIARIEGAGPNKNELVILGAHEDSISSSGNAPGADDDASGVSVLLEAYRILLANGFIPDRSIEFQTYAAEEVGLRGSQDIANNYGGNNVNVYSMLQLDMTMYPSSTPRIGVITDFVDPSLTAFLRKLCTAYADIPFVDTRCGYGCSDHASWTRAGYQACFPFEAAFNNANPRIHTPNDLISYLSVDHGAEFVKVAVGYAVELSLAK